MIDHSSLRRFSTGVPVSATRRPAWRRGRPGLRGAGVLDLLGLVEDEPSPGDRGQLVEVAVRPASRCVSTTSCVEGPHVERLVVVVAGGAVVDEHASCGAKRASSRSQLPSTDTGQTTSVGPSARVGEQRGDELGGLAQAHVVGQAGAEAEPAEEREPAGAPLLVRPQLAVEAGRVGSGSTVAWQRVVEQRCRASRRRRRRRRRPRLPRRSPSSSRPETGPQQVRRRGLPTTCRPGSSNDPELTRVDLHPLAAQPHQRPLRLARPRPAPRGRRFVRRCAAEGGLPAEADDRVHVEARRRHRAGSGVASSSGPAPRGGAGGSTTPGGARGSPCRASGAERSRRMAWITSLSASTPEGAATSRRPASSGARRAMRPSEASTSCTAPGPNGDVPSHTSARGTTRLVSSGSWASSSTRQPVVLLRRLVDPDAQPQLARHHGARADPRGDLFGEGPCRLRVDPRRQLGIGADQRAHPRLGQGRASPPARRELGARPDELVADDGVDCGRQGVRGAPLAGRGRIGDQASDAWTIDRTRQRPPPGPGSAVLADGQARYEEAARDERAGHAVHLAVVVAIVERLIDGRWIDRAHGGAPSPVWTRSGRFGLE